MRTFLDELNNFDRLNSLGDPLLKLKEIVDFEIFRPLLEKAWSSEDNRAGGRQRLDRVMMFKVLQLGEMYSIGDDSLEYQITDRNSWKRFLGLELGDRAPDAKTIWKYREELVQSGLADELFELYNEQLELAGFITHKGSIVDATITPRPQQRHTKDKRKAEKNGETLPDETNENVLRQQDNDATYTVKRKRPHYGYKSHIKMDADSKIITAQKFTTASTHDSRVVEDLIDDKDEKLYADSAYKGKNISRRLKRKNKNLKLKIHQKAVRGKPLTDRAKALNKSKSKVRCRVEHGFGHMVKSMGGKVLRKVGLARNALCMTLKNIAYNMHRAVILSASRGQSTLLQQAA